MSIAVLDKQAHIGLNHADWHGDAVAEVFGCWIAKKALRDDFHELRNPCRDHIKDGASDCRRSKPTVLATEDNSPEVHEGPVATP